jgi:hypothetical protein
MSDKDKAKDNSQTPEITRRATFKLATAVAAFGTALGMRANSARAEEKGTTKEGSAKLKLDPPPSKREGRADDKHKDKGSAKYKEEGSGYIKKGK